MENIRKHLVFHGTVQGVGFRWTARGLANKLGISGWVENLYDGSVEMEAEGTPQEIAALIHGLEQARWAEVTSIDEQVIPPQGGYGFEIR